MNEKTKAILEILFIIALFLLLSYLVQTNLEFFQKLMGNNIYGMIVYVLIAITAIVVAPVTSLPLISVASNLWGVNITTFLSVVGWSIGSIIAFILARNYGVDTIKKLISLGAIHKFEKKIPEENIFWGIVFLRMITPPDVLSYALSLFSKMKLSHYIVATVIGLIPFAFVWAYIGLIPFQYQIIILLTAGIIFLVGYLGYFLKRNKN